MTKVAPLTDINWEDISLRLAAYVSYRSRRWASAADVEEVVAETLCRVIDDDYKNWDPTTEPVFLRFCMSVANGVLRNTVRRAYRKHEKPMFAALEYRPSQASAERNIVVRDQQRTLERLREVAAADPLVIEILELYSEGVEKTRHLAAKLGRTSPEIHNAKRRLLGHIEKVRAELNLEVSNV